MFFFFLINKNVSLHDFIKNITSKLFINICSGFLCLRFRFVKTFKFQMEHDQKAAATLKILKSRKALRKF